MSLIYRLSIQLRVQKNYWNCLVTQPTGILATLDVESLFTNVPIDDTISIILNSVYRHPNIPPPNLPKETLKKLLEICTKESPFKHIDGTIYKQKDGVAMGSPLGCIFANYYMTNIEENVLASATNEPTLYARYVPDIILVVNSEDRITDLFRKMKNVSVRKFTYEIGYDKLQFLYVSIKTNNDHFQTSVF